MNFKEFWILKIMHIICFHLFKHCMICSKNKLFCIVVLNWLKNLPFCFGQKCNLYGKRFFDGFKSKLTCRKSWWMLNLNVREVCILIWWNFKFAHFEFIIRCFLFLFFSILKTNALKNKKNQMEILSNKIIFFQVSFLFLKTNG